MIAAIPKVDIYYIDFSKEVEKERLLNNNSSSEELNIMKQNMSLALDTIKAMPSAISKKKKKEDQCFDIVENDKQTSDIATAFTAVGNTLDAASIFLARQSVNAVQAITLENHLLVELKRLISDKTFHVIKTPDELEKYVNAQGNSWVLNSKQLREKQFYIRHPKMPKNNVLIEACSFHRYIEEEQKTELVNYIMTHCPAKSIQITRFESVGVKNKSRIKLKTKVDVGCEYSKAQGNYFTWKNPNGANNVEPREEYFWLEPSLMSSIETLSSGATFEQEYEYDYSFGLTAREAKTIGIDLSLCKKYIFTITIEC